MKTFWSINLLVDCTLFWILHWVFLVTPPALMTHQELPLQSWAYLPISTGLTWPSRHSSKDGPWPQPDLTDPWHHLVHWFSRYSRVITYMIFIRKYCVWGTTQISPLNGGSCDSCSSCYFLLSGMYRYIGNMVVIYRQVFKYVSFQNVIGFPTFPLSSQTENQF